MAAGQQISASNGTGKAAASALSGAISTIAVWYMKYAKGIEVPAEVAIAGATIFTTLLVWAIPHQWLNRGA